MAALAHLPPAALDYSSSPIGTIATKLKYDIFPYLNNDRVEYGNWPTIFRYRIESTTAEGWISVIVAVQTTTMALNFDSSGPRDHTIPRYSKSL
jgi:hypothetical protein